MNVKDMPTEQELSHLNPEFAENPAKMLKRVREQCPVLPARTFTDELFLTRYDDTRSVLMDRTMSVDPAKANPGTSRHQAMSQRDGVALPIFLLDDPEHRRLKIMVAQAFSPQAVEARRADIERVVDTLLDACEAKGEGFDALADFAIPLPVIVIARFMGIPESDMDKFRRWSTDFTATVDPFKTSEELDVLWQSVRQMNEYFVEIIEERRKSPQSDLITSMVTAEEEGDQMTTDEIRAMCNGVLVAGNITTTDLIGNAILRFLQNPDQLTLFREDWSLAPNAVEEVLRLDSPVALVGRAATQAGEMRGCPYEAGHVFTMSLTAANLDPDKIADPERFDITRERIEHLALGAGIHLCLGAAVARTETQIALTRLFKRFPDLQLGPKGYVRKPSAFFRGLEELHVVI